MKLLLFFYLFFTLLSGVTNVQAQSCTSFELDSLDLKNPLVDKLIETLDDPSVNFNNCEIFYQHVDGTCFIFYIHQFSGIEGGLFNDFVIIANNAVDELMYNHHQSEEQCKFGSYCFLSKNKKWILSYQIKDDYHFSSEKVKLIFDFND